MIGLAGKVCRRLAAEAREFRRWDALCRADDIRVYYGMDRLPARDEPVSGGIVKCLDLAERFPNAAGKANLLYLVSSALPDRRELLARAARRAGGRFALNQNGVAYPAWAGAAWRERNAPNARVHAMADFVVYQSEFCRRCAERFLGAPKGPGDVLYNPVDTTFFTPAARDVRHDEPRLLVAGTHQQAYRVQQAVETLRHLQQNGVAAQLLVAGRLAWRADAMQCQKDALAWAEDARVGSRVKFVGPYSQMEAPGVFRRADILLHTTYNDACPRTVVEAMACGLPVVYSASGGVPELVDEKSGVGIPAPQDWERIHPPSAEALAEAVMRVLASYDDRARAARHRAETTFDVKPWLDRHAEWFARLLANRD